MTRKQEFELIENGVKLVDLWDQNGSSGVVETIGAKGKLKSEYCRDPDEN